MNSRPVPNERPGWAFGTGVAIVKPVLLAITSRDWAGGDRIPDGGCVIVANHLSHLDPFTFAHFVFDHGRVVRFLAKQEIFDMPLVGTIAKNAGQIPVPRLTADAAKSFTAAVDAVREGKAVAFYPEGTLTRDPDLWPMTGKTGAARVALTTGCPVIPVGQWGVQEILPPYGRPRFPFPRRRVRVRAGEAVDMSDLQGRPLTHDVLVEATDRIMAAITDIVADLRGEVAPVERFDPRRRGVKQIGNPKKSKKSGKSQKSEKSEKQ